MIVAEPAATPVTTPVPVPTVAMPVLLLVQIPPPVALDKVVPEPVHTVAVPVTAAGKALTVAVAEAKQPVLKVYVMPGVPAATPVIIPLAEPIVACAVLLLLQTPPPVALVRVVVRPTQTDAVPAIAAGMGLTVTAAVTRQPVLSA